MGAGVTSHQGEPPTYGGNGAGAQLIAISTAGHTGGVLEAPGYR